MYVTVQFIILELLLGLIFLVILYFMLRELLKKIIRKELRDIKEPLQVLANYLVERSDEQGPEDPGEDPNNDPRGGSSHPATGPLPVVSPEKLPDEPVDIANEFNQLKNTNRVSAYNIRVQKIWDLYKQEKITLLQYKDELSRLKKEFGIPMEQEDVLDKEREAKGLINPVGKGTKVKPLTPTPSAAPKQKVKKIDTGTPVNPSEGPHKNNERENGKENGNGTKTETGKSAANSDGPAMDPDKDNKAARLDQ